MPRHTHPEPKRKHGRAHVRHHRERIRARHLRDWYERSLAAADFPPPKDIAVRHPFDCGNAQCFCCHSEKLLDAKRRRRWQIED